MDREYVLSVLRKNAQELKAAGIEHLRVFGSVARSDSTASSDVDLLADFDPKYPLTLLTLGRAQIRLEGMLGCNVDLATEAWLRPSVRAAAAQESLVAF